MNEIQIELNNYYKGYLNKALNDKEICNKIKNDNISSPLFINTNTLNREYFDSEFRILYVGKENNGWFGLNERKNEGVEDILVQEKYFASLLGLYERFELGKNYKKPFFQFLDILKEQFKHENIKAGILWTNLVRFDCCNTGDCWNLRNRIFELDNNEILRKEIEILKPNIVLFATGPNYDYILSKSFLGYEVISINDKSVREKCKIKHEYLPNNTFRIYHPDYHLRMGSGYRHELVAEIFNLVNN